jgi:DNA-binding CsgD family transcriptional regulator
MAIVGLVLNEAIEQAGPPSQIPAEVGDLPGVLANFAARHALSPREVQILGLAALSGLSSKEIGTMLGSSRRTVEAHWSNIFHRLRIHSRREVVAAIIAQAIDDLHDRLRPDAPRVG